MNCWGLSRATTIRTIGLCHSIPVTVQQLANDISVPIGEIDYLVGGINHLGFFLRLQRNGDDLYPQLRQVVAEGRVPAKDRVRYEVLQRLGYFATESSEHFSEYVPWFIKRGREDLIERFNIPLDEYPRRCRALILAWRALRERLSDPARPVELSPSVEYGSMIIQAVWGGSPARVYGNVVNAGLIENLPPDCIVEVPCLAGRDGVRPMQVGRLPPQLAALMQTSINVQQLVVEAVLSGRRDHVYHAAMLDPHTAAELDLDQIRSLVDELIVAHASWLPASLGGTAGRGKA
jgi:alpha-galactosidase